MNLPRIRVAFAGCVLACSMWGMGQEQGSWRAASKTARSITGDVVLSNEKIFINFAGFTMAQIRALNQNEMSAAFDADSASDGRGNLYRLSIPGAKKFLHSNTLCGGEDTQWVATYATGRSLQLAFFSGPNMPVFTLEALGNSTDLCGTYSYMR